MRVTRRAHTVVGLGIFLGFWGILLDSRPLVAGVAGVAAWLLARQWLFVRGAARTDADLNVRVTTTAERVAVDEPVEVILEASTARPAALDVEVTVRPPTGAAGDPVTVAVPAGEESAVAHAELSWPVTGEYAIDDVTATYADPAGLFAQSTDREAGPTVRVEARAPRDLHVGEGGDSVATTFGQHETGRTGSGLEPAEVRKYDPGDSIRQIDWKATARLAEPHVREFEARTDRETLLFVDHRASMGDGPPGESKLDYVRQVVLSVADSAGEMGDPVGYYAVGDRGLTESVEPAATRKTISAVRRSVFDLTPTASEADDRDDPASPVRARELERRLDADETPFGRTLTPYVAARQSYVRRFEERPLFRAVERHRTGRGGAVWTVLFTDDANRRELREAARLAGRDSGRVAVFLTPGALFAADALGDLESTYERYLDFEEFRRELNRLPGVSAYEVGPGDTLSAVLETGRAVREGVR